MSLSGLCAYRRRPKQTFSCFNIQVFLCHWKQTNTLVQVPQSKLISGSVNPSIHSYLVVTHNITNDLDRNGCGLMGIKVSFEQLPFLQHLLKARLTGLAHPFHCPEICIQHGKKNWFRVGNVQQNGPLSFVLSLTVLFELTDDVTKERTVTMCATTWRQIAEKKANKERWSKAPGQYCPQLDVRIAFWSQTTIPRILSKLRQWIHGSPYVNLMWSLSLAIKSS